ncbi:MAG: hypothetical protein B6I19_10965 [Bacteroidetes bacterium 4572_114]|nr:MAG: hypothetical protein B6I19_10965 [Bacteroidetes bacterium 4572_114]
MAKKRIYLENMRLLFVIGNGNFLLRLRPSWLGVKNLISKNIFHYLPGYYNFQVKDTFSFLHRSAPGIFSKYNPIVKF